MKFHLLKQAVIGPEVPMAVFENLYNTRDNDLKVILYTLQKGQADAMDIARNLDISMSSVQSSLLFWADKGIIMVEDEDNAKPKKKKLLSATDILKISESHPEIEILVSAGDGPYSASAWGCDLTYDYVKINGDYRT